MSVAMKPIPILQIVNILGVGGAEGQFLERVRSLDLDRWRPVVVALKRQGTHLAELTRLGLPPRELPLGPSFAHPRTPLAILELARLIRREGIKLVHAQDFYTNLLSVPAARLGGARVIVSRLDLAHWHGARRRTALAWASRQADLVQVNALAIERQLVEEERIPRERIRCVQNGLDLARFDRLHAAPLLTPLPWPAGALVVTVIANLHPIKGQEDVIAAVSLLAGRFPALHLQLAGDGSRREALRERARALGVEERVHFLGHRGDVPAVLAATQVLVSSSRAEGLSNSVVEGLAARLPVIATAVGGTPELIEDGRTGLLVPPRSPVAIARALERLLPDEPLRRRLGEAGRRLVEEKLELRQMARDFDRLYAELLEQPPARA